MTNRLHALRSRTLLRPKQNEEGFTLIEFMIVATVILILAMMAAPVLTSFGQLRLTGPVEKDVRSAADRAATYFTRYPNSQEITTATPACEGGAKNVQGLLITVSANNNCISVWGTPTDFYVRGTNPNLAGEFLYSSKEQKYTRSGVFQTTRPSTNSQGANE